MNLKTEFYTFLALIIGLGIVGGSAFTAFAASSTNTSSTTDINETKSCCTQNAQCCKENADRFK